MAFLRPYINDGKKSHTFMEVLYKPPWLEYSIDKKEIAPGDTAEVRMVAVARKVPDLGYFGENFQFKTDDAFYATKSLGISVEIAQDFSNLSKKERRHAPRISFDKTFAELGEMVEGSNRNASFTVYNKGKSPLEIRKIKTHCSCTVVGKYDKVIPKNGSTVLTVTFDSVFKNGSQTKTVTVYSNDPQNPQSVLTIHADVLEP
jgi:hypothetical protein